MIPILLDPSKSLSELVEDKTNGIGRLSVISECTVSEERNGAFTASFDYPITGKYYKNIDVDSLVKIKPNEDADDQIFRVVEISRPINGVCTYSLNHITYDLSKTAVTPFTAKGATQACIELKAHLVTGAPFEIQADGLNEDSTFTVSEPQSLRSLLGGQSGSMLDTFGGEYEWNNQKVILHLHRGTDNDVSIRYGKNLTDISHDTNAESMYTAIYPYAKANETVIQGTLHTIKDATVPSVKSMDFSSYFGQDEEITSDKVNAKCDSYIASNDLTVPKVNIKVSFQPLAKTEEYKNIAPLEHVALCDTVHVYYPKLGVKASAKVISYEYDVLKEQYNTIELGDAKNSLSDTIADQSAAIKQNQVTTSGQISQVMQSIIDSTNSIRGGSGGYVVLNKDSNGVNREILIMDTPDQQTAKNVIRANKNGIGFSNTGVNGVFNSAWKIDGTFDAAQINVINLTASMFLGSTIDLGGLDNKSGVLKLRDENNNVIGTLTKDGLVMYGQDGSYVKMNNEVGFAGYDKNGTKIYWVSGDEFHMKKSVVEEEITLCSKMRFIPITIYNDDGSIKNDGIGLVSVES
ncbi:MAG: phage tail protein [Solobacterium sp.]|jgi:phage minor structural protein|nr:phage tail protein [Solobacterium sp.]MCH4281510.1 phage tail protein [Solobacterium sp.]